MRHFEVNCDKSIASAVYDSYYKVGDFYHTKLFSSDKQKESLSYIFKKGSK
jgi:hypothetical protein